MAINKKDVENANAVNDALNRGKQTTKEFTAEVQSLIDAFTSIGAGIQTVIEDAIDGVTGIDTATKKVVKTYTRDITNAIKKTVVGLDSQLSIQKKINQGLDVEKDIQKLIEASQTQKTVIQNRIELLQRNINDLTGEQVEELSQLEGELKKVTQLNGRQIAQLKAESKLRAEILGSSGKLVGATDSLLRKIGGDDLGDFFNLGTALDDTAKQGILAKKNNETFNKTSALTKNIAKNLDPKALIGPLTVIANAAFKSFLKTDQKVTDLSRNLSLSRDEAENLKGELASASVGFAKLNGEGSLFGVTINDQIEAIDALNKGLGGVALTFDSKTRVAAAETLKRLKLSEEAVGNMGVLAMATGKSFEELEDTQIASTLEVEKEFGIRLNLKDVLDEANKITGATRVNLEKFPGGLTKAVATAKSLGVEMEAISASAGQLLDFEQSIEKELQAELMIGRDLNLERARQAALQGDQATLMQELVREAGSLEELQSMNVLQQEALAGALGISMDQLSNQVLAGEALATQKDEELNRQAAEAEAQAKALSLSEKQAIAMEKLADIASMFAPIMLGIAAAAAAAAIAITFGAASPMIIGGIALAAGAVGAIASQFVSDGMIPSNSGRGPFKITDSFGQTAITDKRDGIAVSPNVSRDSGNNGNSTDMSTTNNLLRQLVAKREVVEIDGSNAGTAFGTSARRIQ